MPIGGPPVAPSVRSFLGVARELFMGTAVGPTNTIPVDKGSYAPEDMPKFLPDEALRGNMAGLYNEIIGPADASFSFGGPNFLDVHGFMLDNLFGDLSTTGSSGASGTTLSGTAATLAIGGTQCTVASVTGYAAGSAVMIDSGSVAEVVVLSAAPSGTVLTFGNNPLRFPHQAGASVFTVSAPFVHKFALLNSQLGYGGVAGAQPPTHTLTDNTNLNYAGSPGTNTSGARAYPGAAVSEVSILRERGAVAFGKVQRELLALAGRGKHAGQRHLHTCPRGQLARQHLHRRHRPGQPRHGHRRVDCLDEEAVRGILDGRRERVALHYRSRAVVGNGRPVIHYAGG